MSAMLRLSGMMSRLFVERSARFASLLSPWERLGEGCWPQASIAIRANLKGLGYGF